VCRFEDAITGTVHWRLPVALMIIAFAIFSFHLFNAWARKERVVANGAAVNPRTIQLLSFASLGILVGLLACKDNSRNFARSLPSLRKQWFGYLWLLTPPNQWFKHRWYLRVISFATFSLTSPLSSFGASSWSRQHHANHTAFSTAGVNFDIGCGVSEPLRHKAAPNSETQKLFSCSSFAV